MKNIKIFLAAVCLITMTISLSAQNPPHPNGGNNPGGTNVPVGGGAPIDGGLSILLVLGAAYGIKKRLNK